MNSKKVAPKHAYIKNWDLGIRRLWPQWKALLSTRYLREDILAGLTVACVAIPLSLAISLASGVTPEVGLVTAVVAGIVCAFFGGTPLAVSGPAAAMAVLVASIVQTHGMGGLLVIGLGCGALQILFGVFGLGKLARYMPMPVIAGFTAGIGAVIFIGQLPRALGLPPPPESETLSVITHLTDLLHQTRVETLGLTLLTAAIIFLLPKVLPKVPATLVAVVVSSLLASALSLPVDLIGKIPDSLPLPKFPELPQEGLWPLFMSTFTIFALASLETLLSSTAVDKIVKQQRHDPDQELIGQGLGNLLSSMFGGIPVTGVIARSALNIQAGAKTRRSAIIHSIALILTIYFASSLIGKIPIAALAGVLVAVSLRMMNLREFREIWHVSKAEGTVFIITFLSIVSFDLLVGIQVGVLVAVFITAIRGAKTFVEVHSVEGGDSTRIHVTGALSFMSSSSLEMLRNGLETARAAGQRRFIIDMSDVYRIDATGAEELISIVYETENLGGKIVLQGMLPNCRQVLDKADHKGVLKGKIAVTETDVQMALYGNDKSRGVGRLIYGINRFRSTKKRRYQSLLDQLADGQSPHTLFLTCSDSRINPNLLTSTDLGELFVMRNVGNAIPPASATDVSSERGALEFAIKALGVREIVICGHTGCGAMSAICGHSDLSQTPELAKYLNGSAFKGVKEASANDAELASRLNIIQQWTNLTSYPYIKKMIESGDLSVHLWLYDLKNADVDIWSAKTGTFQKFEDGVPPLSSGPNKKTL